MSGPAGRKEGFHPFNDMKGEELRVELTARGNSDEGNKRRSAKEIISIAGRNNNKTSCTAIQ